MADLNSAPEIHLRTPPTLQAAKKNTVSPKSVGSNETEKIGVGLEAKISKIGRLRPAFT